MTSEQQLAPTHEPWPLDPALARLHRRAASTRVALAQLPATSVRDPQGGRTELDLLVARQRALREHVTRAPAGRHARVSPFQRVLMRVLPVLDGIVLFWFLTGVLNVDLRALDPTLLVAAALAVLASVALSAWAAVVGQRLQTAADPDGTLLWGAVDTTTRTMCAATGIVWLLVGAMMFVRVRDEAFQATGVLDVRGVVIATVLAAAVVVVNAYVLVLAFSDGSADTRALDALGRAVHPHLRRRERLERRLADLTQRLRSRATAHSAAAHR